MYVCVVLTRRGSWGWEGPLMLLVLIYRDYRVGDLLLEAHHRIACDNREMNLGDESKVSFLFEEGPFAPGGYNTYWRGMWWRCVGAENSKISSEHTFCVYTRLLTVAYRCNTHNNLLNAQ